MVLPAKETFEGAQLDLTDSPLHTIQWARVILDEADELAVVTPRGATECWGHVWTLLGFQWLFSCLLNMLG